jgi:hypothetical protein
MGHIGSFLKGKPHKGHPEHAGRMDFDVLLFFPDSGENSCKDVLPCYPGIDCRILLDCNSIFHPSFFVKSQRQLILLKADGTVARAEKSIITALLSAAAAVKS